MSNKKSKTVLKALEELTDENYDITVDELVVITGLKRKQVTNNLAYLGRQHIIEKSGNRLNRRYRYVSEKVHNGGELESNQEDFVFPLIKCALRLFMSVNTSVHIGWKTPNGNVFCLCGINQSAKKKTTNGEFNPSNWNEVDPEKYKIVTCKSCIRAWYANRTRPGDTLSAQDYVREKIRREHLERTTGNHNSSSRSEPVPLDDKMADEPIIKKQRRVVTITLEDGYKPNKKEGKPITEKTFSPHDFREGDTINVQIKVAKLEHAPAAHRAESYKCQFCCFNGLRPCPKASLDRGESRYLCYEIGPEYYFIEVLHKQ